jgi:hypothetical protein
MPSSDISFEEMWAQADYEDASIGGVDNIPDWEYRDYMISCMMNQFQEKSYAKQ